jgi:hypothetical protein
LGYKSGTKGFVALDLHSHEIVVLRNVQFEELIFPYSSQNNKSQTTWEYFIPPIDPEPSLIPVSATQFEFVTPLVHEPSTIDYVDPPTTTDIIVPQTESPQPTPPPNQVKNITVGIGLGPGSVLLLKVSCLILI